jgi:hypothetical protein
MDLAQKDHFLDHIGRGLGGGYTCEETEPEKNVGVGYLWQQRSILDLLPKTSTVHEPFE